MKMFGKGRIKGMGDLTPSLVGGPSHQIKISVKFFVEGVADERNFQIFLHKFVVEPEK